MKSIIKPKIKIGAHTIETKEVKSPSVSTPGLVCYGCYIQGKNLIELKKDLPLTRKEETWLHEVLHAIDLTWNTGLTERQIGILSPAIYLALVENGMTKR